MTTRIARGKRLTQVAGRCTFDDAQMRGYEIHMGVSEGPALLRPVWDIGGRAEGARSPDDQILGTYVHGLFDHPPACAALLRWAGLDSGNAVDPAQLREESLDRVADAAMPLWTALMSMAK